MNAQEYEDRGNLRIKFASTDQFGFLARDASEEYGSFFAEAPSGWSVTSAGSVNTLRGDGNLAWFYRTDSDEVVAVEHETGIEILVLIGVGVASGVATEAVVKLVAWAWKRWRDSRAQGIRSGSKAEPTLVVESVEDRFPDGRIRNSRKLEMHGPIDQAAVATVMREWRAA